MTRQQQALQDRPTVLSLFAGAGGIDLGLEQLNCETKWYSEIDRHACRVMAKRYPNAENLGDITQINWRSFNGRPDIIVGGFPCQDISLAGKGAGIDGERSGLWRFYADAIRILRPRGVLVENVSALLGRGICRVLGDLAAIGFDAEWDCIPAAAVGAPHRRDRLFIIAYPRSVEHESSSDAQRGQGAAQLPRTVTDAATVQRSAIVGHEPNGNHAMAGTLADTPGTGLEGAGIPGRSADSGTENTGPDRGRFQERAEQHGEQVEDSADQDTRRRHADGLCDEVPDAEGERCRQGRQGRPDSPRPGHTQPEAGNGADTIGSERNAGPGEQWPRRWPEPGYYGWWRVEPDVGRVAHGVPSRVDRLRCLGNAVVPQVAEHVGRVLLERIGP